MRTNIEIDDELMQAALRAGPFTTKKQAVEAGLELIKRQGTYRELLKLKGKLHWDDSPLPEVPASDVVHSPAAPPYVVGKRAASRGKS